MQIKHIVGSALSLILFCSQAANAAVVKIVESGLVSNLDNNNTAGEFFRGVNVAGLPYTRTFFINTLAPGATYEDDGTFRALVGGYVPLSFPHGTPRQPSVAFVSYSISIGVNQSMQFSSIGSYESSIYLAHSKTEALSLIIRSSFIYDRTGQEWDRLQLYFPVSYSLPNEPNFINPGIYTSVGIDNGSSTGIFGFFDASNSPQITGRFELIPTQLVVTTVPEPSEWAMMLVGFALVGYKVKRNKAQS